MASTNKAFKIVCGSASSLFETRWHTQSLRLLFGQGARTRCPWGEICVHCELFLCKSSALVLSLFSRKEGQPSASRDSGPTAAEARRRMKLAVGCGRWVREGPPLFARVGREREWAAGLWRCDLSDIIRFSGYCSSLHMNEFLEVVDHKNVSFWPKYPQLEWAFLSSENLDVEIEKEWKKLFFLVFIGFSILVMLTLRRCLKMAMRGCPLCKRW